MAYEDDDQSPDDNLAGLRKAAADGKVAMAEREALRKELLFARAGIDTDTKLGKLLFRTFDGEDVNELKAEATEIGLLKSDQDDAPARRNADEDQADFRRTLAGGASGVPDDQGPDPIVEALSNFHDDVKSGTPRETAALAAFDRIFSAAAAGDKRAIFDSREYAQEARAYSGFNG